MKGSTEKQIRALFSRHSIPPLEVIIPILQKTGRGEEELKTLIYTAYVKIAEGLREIMGLKGNNMLALAKVWEITASFEGAKCEPIKLNEATFSFSTSDCPMLHIGKDISFDVRSKFCDIVCAGGSTALMDAILASNKGTCTWDKALIKGAKKCKVVFQMAKTT